MSEETYSYFVCKTCESDLYADCCPNDDDCCYNCCKCEACEEQRIEDASMCRVCTEYFTDVKQCSDTMTDCCGCCTCDECLDNRLEDLSRCRECACLFTDENYNPIDNGKYCIDCTR
jgi:hypothetical protein